MESGGSDDDCSGSDGTAQREHESSDDDAHNALDSMSATGRGTVASGKSKVLSRRGLHFARIGPNARNTSNGVDSSNEEDSDAVESASEETSPSKKPRPCDDDRDLDMEMSMVLQSRGGRQTEQYSSDTDSHAVRTHTETSTMLNDTCERSGAQSRRRSIAPSGGLSETGHSHERDMRPISADMEEGSDDNGNILPCRNTGELKTKEHIMETLNLRCPCNQDCMGHFSRNIVARLRADNMATKRTRTASGNGGTKGTVREYCAEVMQHCIIFRGDNRIVNRWRVGGHDVCAEAWRCLHGFTVTTFKKARTLCIESHTPRKDSDALAQISGSLAKEDKLLASSELVSMGQAWYAQWVEDHGCKNPESEIIFVDDVDNKDLYEMYALEMNAFKDPWMSASYFNSKVIATHKHYVKRYSRKPFGECLTCTRLKVEKARVLASRDRDKIRDVKMRIRTHQEHQKQERGHYYAHRTKARTHPSECLSIIMDGMDQSKTNLPHTVRPTKGERHCCETKITGVLVHGDRFNVYINEPQVHSTSNVAIHCLHDTLMDLLEARGQLPKVLYLQVDGGPENKNQWTFGYLALLVHLGVFEKIKVSFLPVGHTHEDIDQRFSRISVALKKKNAFTFDEFVDVVKNAFVGEEHKPAKIEVLHNVFDFKKWVGDYKEMPAGWTKYHIYRLSMNESTKRVQMHYKMWAQSDVYYGFNSDCEVASFKALRVAALSDVTVVVQHEGLRMSSELPTEDVPEAADIHDFMSPPERRVLCYKCPVLCSHDVISHMLW